MPQLDPEVSCNRLVAVGELDSEVEQTVIELASGREVSIPTAALLEGVQPSLPARGKSATGGAKSLMIPVIAEEMVVTKRQVPLETVRLTKSSEAIMERMDVSLAREDWEVERIPMNTEIAERSDARHVGEVTIYPVFEERVITRKALFLVEELHVRRVMKSSQEIVEASLVRESVTVERTKV